MSATDKFDLLLLGFAPRNRKMTGLLLGVSRCTLVSAKAYFKNNSSVKGGSKHSRSLHLWPFCKWKSDLDPASLSKLYFNNLPECYNNSVFCFFQQASGRSVPLHLTKTLV